jgi:hypothetical protein
MLAVSRAAGWHSLTVLRNGEGEGVIDVENCNSKE